MLRVLLIVGTRPEAIKLAPVIAECRQRPGAIEARVCLTGQHDRLLTEAVEYFSLRPDVRLDTQPHEVATGPLSARLIERIDALLAADPPDCVVVEGDTTSAMAGALAAFYRRVRVVHVEAGLRTGDLGAPWPEELHRRVIALATALHCAPTERAVRALLGEGVPETAVRLTGNPVIDALLDTLRRERERGEFWRAKHPMLGEQRMVLITAHRRESFGRGLEGICRAVSRLAERLPDCRFVWPVHPNPTVRRPVHRLLAGRDNVLLSPPVGYPEFVWLMDRAAVILTDSGGVQEEAPTLRTPLLVMREKTERPEVVEAGAAKLVGTSIGQIVAAAERLLTDPTAYAACQIDENPYGDGQAARRIVDAMVAADWSAG